MNIVDNNKPKYCIRCNKYHVQLNLISNKIYKYCIYCIKYVYKSRRSGKNTKVITYKNNIKDTKVLNRFE